ncbi:glycosyltransferase family 2 protein [Alicyclobacillus tolerans]|uniref:glycosyltransferase family 2 protein n=1 Tax=Alicyclobacillus tolerans TaxID=90970 RepID=UPI001F2A3FCE|nr:glycosyltransferase family 2 protein [Alicyclobacillus tolerans]MCF8567762.1 glycosyltransferase family 2 protein [Alicyclobacillus tolerans]
MPHISLVILSYNNWGFTLRCLNSLVASIDSGWAQQGIEILLVDNGSDAQTRTALLEYQATWNQPFIDFKSIMLEENLGYPSGVNVGLAHCRGEIIGILNNDLVFPSGWLEPLIDAIEKDKLVGFAAPFLSFAASTQNVEKQFSSFEEMAKFATDFTKVNRGNFVYVEKVIGACLIMRRDVLLTLGGNDFWFGIGNYDDDDWCLRARLAGYKIALVGASFVEHVGHATFQLDTEQFKNSLNVNAMKFELKWDIMEISNHSGSYTRHGVVLHQQFSRARHYIPISAEQFSSSRKPYYPRSSNQRRFLIGADWTSSQSEWRESLSSVLMDHDDIEVCLWAPKSHFDVKQVTNHIQAHVSSLGIHVASRHIIFTVFDSEVPFVDSLRVLRSADEIVKVKNDFVNRYLIYLAQQTEIKIM